MHRTFPGQTTPDVLGQQRQQRGCDLAHRLQDRGQCRAGIVVAFPESIAGTAHIPVGERVQVEPDVVAGRGEVVGVHRDGDVGDQPSGFGQDVTVEVVATGGRAIGRFTGCGVVAGRGGVQREEIPDVPQGKDHLSHRVANTDLGDRMSPPRNTGEATRNHRIASAPYESNTS